MSVLAGCTVGDDKAPRPRPLGLDRVFEPRYDRNGRDLQTVSAPSARACANACAREGRCRAFTWTAYGNTCWLKDGVSAATPLASQYAPYYASGAQRGLDVNVARSGGNYSTTPLSQPSPYEYQGRCARDSQCQSWEYLMPVNAGDKATCGLKGSVPAAQVSQGVISGVKGLELVP